MELVSGKEPDILYDMVIDLPSLARRGILLPLDDLVAGKLGSDSPYFQNLFARGQVDGTQYSIPYYPYVKYFVTSGTLAQQKTSWTLQECMSLVEASGVQNLSNLTAAQIVCKFGLYDTGNKELIDWEKRESHLEGDLFVKLLKFAKQYAADDQMSRDERRGLIKNGKMAGEAGDNWGFQDLQEYEYLFGQDASFIGYPSTDGTGIYFYSAGFGINASSKHADAAKEFLAWLISEEGQRLWLDYQAPDKSPRGGGLWQLPVRRDLLDEWLERYQSYTEKKGAEHYLFVGLSADTSECGGDGKGNRQPRADVSVGAELAIISKTVKEALPEHSSRTAEMESLLFEACMG